MLNLRPGESLPRANGRSVHRRERGVVVGEAKTKAPVKKPRGRKKTELTLDTLLD
jgi:hypothetical protein